MNGNRMRDGLLPPEVAAHPAKDKQDSAQIHS